MITKTTKITWNGFSTTCILPDCVCMSTAPPMGLDPEEIPQIVFMTFDDAVSNWMYPTYEKIFGNRTNPNGITTL